MAPQTYLSNLFLELDGLMPFERFMKEALYHPRYGYYSRNISSIGRRGDFTTSATISEVLAKAIARWAAQERKEALRWNIGRRWHVIEIGGGDGSLARDFLAQVPKPFRPWLTYHIVEISESLRRKQREKVPRWCVRWHDDMHSALAACAGRALIFSNELVDAFPPLVVRWSEGAKRWEKLVLRDEGVHGYSEQFLSLDASVAQPRTSSVFGQWDADDVPLRDGQRCEVHLSYRDWQSEWLPALECGAILTIDYGAPFPRLYHKHPAGTLRGYFQQVRVQGMEVYDRFGLQDLTADVNFTDLRLWGEAEGLVTIGLADQRAFLLERLPGLEDPRLQRQDAALEFLMSAYGAGKAFQVLQQRRPAPA